VSFGSSLVDAFRSRIERLLRVEERRKLEVYVNTFESASLASLNYWLELLLAAGIATLGLVQNSAAVIIGAMLVSPLMGPIIATGLALALGDFYLGLKALVNIVVSVIAAVLFAAGIVWVLPFQSVTPEILARTAPNLLDLWVAIFSGLAGAIVTCRGGGGGGITALPGVAIAVALMPPLCVVGFGAGVGLEWAIIRGGGLLFLTNLVAIVASSFLTFFVVRMDTPQVRDSINAWQQLRQQGEPLDTLWQRTAYRPLLGRVGSLPRRALILLIFLLSIYVPLRNALQLLREETTVRGAVQSEIRRAFAPDSVVSEQVDLDRQRVRIRVITTESMSAEKRQELQSRLASRTGRSVGLVVHEVARREDVLTLGRRLETVPMTVPELERARQQLLAVVESALAGVWPEDSAPLVDYSLNLHASGLQLQLVYLSEAPLSVVGEETVRRAVESRTGSGLDLLLQQVEPRRELFRWDPRLRQPPDASERALAELGGLLRAHARLSCRLLLPQRARDELAESLAKRLQDLGARADRLQAGKSEGRDSRIWALLEKPKP
jgi:uncharacterized hydrophobic protein (TIGR00271 family)